jgi:hypothetical protein
MSQLSQLIDYNQLGDVKVVYIDFWRHITSNNKGQYK